MRNSVSAFGRMSLLGCAVYIKLLLRIGCIEAGRIPVLEEARITALSVPDEPLLPIALFVFDVINHPDLQGAGKYFSLAKAYALDFTPLLISLLCHRHKFSFVYGLAGLYVQQVIKPLIILLVMQPVKFSYGSL